MVDDKLRGPLDKFCWKGEKGLTDIFKDHILLGNILLKRSDELQNDRSIIQSHSPSQPQGPSIFMGSIVRI